MTSSSLLWEERVPYLHNINEILLLVKCTNPFSMICSTANQKKKIIIESKVFPTYQRFGTKFFPGTNYIILRIDFFEESRKLPRIHLHVVSVEEENSGRYKRNVKIVNINLNFLGINIYDCYRRKLRNLPRGLTKLHSQEETKRKRKSLAQYLNTIYWGTDRI